MTLDDIVRQVKKQTHMKRMRIDSICRFANRGIADIVSNIKVLMHEEYFLGNHSAIDMQNMSHLTFDIEEIINETGESVPFDVQIASEYIVLPHYVYYCTIAYRYIPCKLHKLNDSIDLPEELHRLVVLYAVAAAKCLLQRSDAAEALAAYTSERDKAKHQTYIYRSEVM